MKKVVILSLIFTACVVVSCSKSGEKGEKSGNTPNTLQQSGLKGSVKMVETRTYEALMRFGEIEKGELADVMNIYSSLTICPHFINEFNKDGNTTKVTVIDNRERIYQIHKLEYFQNHQIAYFLYEADGQLSSSRKYILENGKPVGMEYYSPSYHYDSILCMFDGFNPTKVIYYRDRKIEQKVENRYQNGILVSSANYQQAGTGYYSDWTINDAGMVTHYRFRDDKEDLTVEDLSYNQHLITRYTRFNSWEGKVDYTMEYLTFDEQGNWLSRVICQNDQPLYLQERTIEYYGNSNEPDEQETIQKRKEDKVEIPTTKHEIEPAVIKVYIDALGNYSVAKGKEEPQGIVAENLKDYLYQCQAQDSNATVILSADEAVAYSDVVYVLDIINELQMRLVVSAKQEKRNI